MTAINTLRKDLPPMPTRMKALRIDDRGFPVPWFVAWIDGKPDFRVIRSNGINIAWTKGLCWLCGQRRGNAASFVIGPMCAVNRVSSEPPSHLACAMFAARACPFLTRPLAKRVDHGLPADHRKAAGFGISRNPVVALVWTSANPSRFAVGEGWLFDVGEPAAVKWVCEGRPATREEVMHSIDTGLPFLREMADAEGVEANAALDRMLAQALTLLPLAPEIRAHA